MKIEIKRSYGEKQTEGLLTVSSAKGRFAGHSIELPWKDNAKGISCIPEGTYELNIYNSPKFGRCLIVKDVPGRDAILIHKGNYNSDTHGCILPGCGQADINKDGLLDVIKSGPAMEIILNLWDGSGTLTVT